MIARIFSRQTGECIGHIHYYPDAAGWVGALYGVAGNFFVARNGEPYKTQGSAISALKRRGYDVGLFYDEG